MKSKAFGHLDLEKTVYQKLWALAAAENCDREIADGKYRGPLHGVPIGIKDLLYTRGITTSAGMQVRAKCSTDI